MKKYRKFIIPFIIIVLIVSLAIPSYAEQYGVTLKDLIGYRTSAVSTYWLDDLGSRYYCDFFWVSDNELRVMPILEDDTQTLPTLKGGAGVDVIYTIDNYPVSSNYYLYFKCPRLDVTPIVSGTDFENLDSYRLTFDFIFTDRFGQKHTVTVYNGFATSFYDGNVRSVAFSFEYGDYVNSTYAYLSGMQFSVWMPEANWTRDRLNFWTYDLEFYLGDAENGPIYSGPDTSYLDSLEALEGDLRSQTSSSIQAGINMLTSITQVIGPSSPMGKGALAVTELMTPVIYTEPIYTVLRISLSVGLIMFVIGTVSWITGRGSRKNKNKGGKSG